ncbi:MAG: hypothetical protein KBS97_01465 [Firmicutes bacterium]|nr:hypothetical protein [Candidatus Fiminaster equi]
MGFFSKKNREKRKEIRGQVKDFNHKLNALYAKKYRYSLRYEDSLIKDDGKAYVNVDLTKIDSPFSVFSYEKRMDPDIYDYIDQQVFYLRAEIPVVINFDDGGKYSEELKDKIKKCVTRHYHLQYEDVRYEHHRSMLFGFILALIGLLMLGLHFAIMYIFKDKQIEIINEITLIISWMFVWSSVDTFVVSGHSKRVDITNSGQLALADITFGKAKQ